MSSGIIPRLKGNFSINRRTVVCPLSTIKTDPSDCVCPPRWLSPAYCCCYRGLGGLEHELMVAYHRVLHPHHSQALLWPFHSSLDMLKINSALMGSVVPTVASRLRPYEWGADFFQFRFSPMTTRTWQSADRESACLSGWLEISLNFIQTHCDSSLTAAWLPTMLYY